MDLKMPGTDLHAELLKTKKSQKQTKTSILTLV